MGGIVNGVLVSKCIFEDLGREMEPKESMF